MTALAGARRGARTFTSCALRGYRCHNRGRDYRVHGQRPGLRCLASYSSRRVRPELRAATPTIFPDPAPGNVLDHQQGIGYQLDCELPEGLRRHVRGNRLLGGANRTAVALRVLRARFMTLFHLGVDTNTKICLRRPTDESGAPSPFLRVLPSPQTLSGRRIDGPGDGMETYAITHPQNTKSTVHMSRLPFRAAVTASRTAQATAHPRLYGV